MYISSVCVNILRMYVNIRIYIYFWRVGLTLIDERAMTSLTITPKRANDNCSRRIFLCVILEKIRLDIV